MDDGMDEKESALIDAFLATDEMDAWHQLYEAVSATKEGQETAELPLAFLKLILPDIASNPDHFRAVKEAWNRTCDAQGVPERKHAVDDTDDYGDKPF